MAKKNTNEDLLKGQNELAREYLDLLQQSKLALREMKKALKGNLDEQALVTDETKETVDLAKTLAGYTVEQLANKKDEVRFEDKLKKVRQEEAAIQSKISTLLKNNTKESRKLAEHYQRQLGISKASAKEAQKILDTYKRINKETAFFDKMNDFVKSVPLLSKLFPEMEKAATAAREAAANNESAFKAANKAMTDMANKVIGAFGINVLRKGLIQVDNSIQGIGRSLNIGNEAAHRLYKELKVSGDYLSTDLVKGILTLNKAFGSVGGGSAELAETIATISIRMGIQAGTVSKLFAASASAGKDLKEYTASIISNVKMLNLANKSAVDYKAVMEDIGSASAATRLSLQQFPGGITKAAFEARKLGLTLGQLEKTQSSLLNFESSIAAELEAELLTGQSLNLEKARMYALTNDMDGLQKELTRQNITQAKFSKMNYLAQEATAKALGMSRNEMAEMFEKQKAQADLAKFAKNIVDSELGTKAKLNLLMEKGMSLSEATKRLGLDELKYRKEQATLQERQAILMDKLVTAGEAFFKVLEPVKGILKFAADNAQLLLKTMLAIAAIRFTRSLGGLGTSLKGMNTSATAAQSGLVKSASSPTGFRNAAGQFAKAPQSVAAATSGGGFFKNIAKTGKNLLGKVGEKATSLAAAANPLKSAGAWVGKNISKVLKLPIISSIIEGFFAKSDIESMIATAKDKDTLYQDVGKRSWQALGSIGGAAIGASLGSFIPIPGVGTAIGMLGGDMAGRWLSGLLADAIGAKGMGKFVIDTAFPKAKANAPKELALATGGITTGPTRALIGEAGQEAVIPLTELYSKFDALLAAVEKGGNVYMDGNIVGHSLALASNKSN